MSKQKACKRNVYNRFIHIGFKQETIRMPISWWLDKVRPFLTMEYHPAWGEGTGTQRDTDASKIRYAAWPEPDPRGCTHCVLRCLSRVRLRATPWTAARQAPPSMGFLRQEYWGGLPLPSPGDLPEPGIEPGDRRRDRASLTSTCIWQVGSFPLLPPGKYIPWLHLHDFPEKAEPRGQKTSQRLRGVGWTKKGHKSIWRWWWW